MGDIEFLKDKGLLEDDCKEFTIAFQDGRSFNLGEMLNEYSNAKALEFANWLTKFSDLAFNNSLWRFNKDVYTNKEMLELFLERESRKSKE